MFSVEIGEKGLQNSWQADFKPTMPCGICNNEARIAFVVHEDYEGDKAHDEQDFVTRLHANNKDNKFWPNDCVAVAVYFCIEGHVHAEYNQA